jgi:hypothetical protein
VRPAGALRILVSFEEGRRVAMLLYHGTTADVAESGLKEGLKPRSLTKKAGNWKHDMRPSRGDCVHLTDVYGAYFAFYAGEVADTKVFAVVEVDTDRLEVSALLPDEDYLASVPWRVDPLPTVSMRRWVARTNWFRERLEEFADYWYDSLFMLGNCCYKGTIPPGAITRIASFTTLVVNAVVGLLFDAPIGVRQHVHLVDKYRLLNDWLFGERVRTERWFAECLLPLGVEKVPPEMRPTGE